MLTSKEIRSTTFVTVRKGYAIEDVDAFLNKVAGELETLQNECAAMLKEKDDSINALINEKKELEEKMMVLADKVEDYRTQENTIHNAFISAEKMKEGVLEEARQTSEILLRDAQTKADRIIETAASRVSTENANYEALHREVSRFKNVILDAYKSHLGLIAALPDSVSDAELRAAMSDAGREVPAEDEPAEEEKPAEPEQPAETPAPEETEQEVIQESLLDDIAADSDLVDDMLDEAERTLASDGDGDDADPDEDDEYEEDDDEEDFGSKFSFEQ